LKPEIQLGIHLQRPHCSDRKIAAGLKLIAIARLSCWYGSQRSKDRCRIETRPQELIPAAPPDRSDLSIAAGLKPISDSFAV